MVTRFLLEDIQTNRGSEYELLKNMSFITLKKYTYDEFKPFTFRDNFVLCCSKDTNQLQKFLQSPLRWNNVKLQ